MQRLLAEELAPQGRGWIAGRLHDLGRFPGAVPAAYGERVYGEVFALRNGPGVLDALDRFEGYDPGCSEASLFLRRPVRVAGPPGADLLAWAYLFNGDTRGAPLIPGGDYRAYLRGGRGAG